MPAPLTAPEAQFAGYYAEAPGCRTLIVYNSDPVFRANMAAAIKASRAEEAAKPKPAPLPPLDVQVADYIAERERHAALAASTPMAEFMAQCRALRSARRGFDTRGVGVGGQ